MKYQEFKRLCALLIISLIFAGNSVLSAPKTKPNVRKPNAARAETILIRCPDFVKAVTDVESGWVRAEMTVKFSKVQIIPTYNGNPVRILCMYEVAPGNGFNLWREIPKNYNCTQQPNPKYVECKSLPPIKIGGNKNGK